MIPFVQWFRELAVSFASLAALSFIFMIYILQGQEWGFIYLFAQTIKLLLFPFVGVYTMLAALMPGGALTMGVSPSTLAFLFVALAFLFSPLALLFVADTSWRWTLWGIWAFLWACLCLFLNAVTYA